MEGLSVPGHSKEEDCGDGTVYCWMQCMPTKDLNCTKDEIKCADYQGKIWKKETAEMCPECQLRCEAPPTATRSGFGQERWQGRDRVDGEGDEPGALDRSDQHLHLYAHEDGGQHADHARDARPANRALVGTRE